MAIIRCSPCRSTGLFGLSVPHLIQTTTCSRVPASCIAFLRLTYQVGHIFYLTSRQIPLSIRFRSPFTCFAAIAINTLCFRSIVVLITSASCLGNL